MKLEKIEPGMTLYDRHKYKMGNTAIRTIGEWTVKVLELVDGGAMVSWNGNRPQFYGRRQLEALSTWSMYNRDVATFEKGMMGNVSRVRKLTKAEREARKEKP